MILEAFVIQKIAVKPAPQPKLRPAHPASSPPGCPGDLAVTTDDGDVLFEILVRRLNNPATDAIFLDYQPKALNILK